MEDAILVAALQKLRFVVAAAVFRLMGMDGDGGGDDGVHDNDDDDDDG